MESLKILVKKLSKNKNLKQAGSEQDFNPKECQNIVSLRGSNQIEIMDAEGDKSLDIRHIPIDLVIDILMRLPAKSLMRFKCVSKEWSSLISCQYFCKRFYTATRRLPRLYMCLLAGDNSEILLSISSTSPDNTCLVVDQDLNIPKMAGPFLNVVRGLLCFSVREKARIYNPTTGQFLTLPAIKSNIIAYQGQRMFTDYYIGHDPVNDQYKLVGTISVRSENSFHHKSEHWVFVLETGGSWKKIVTQKDYHHHIPCPVGKFINGPVVHYMGRIDKYTCVLVSFDIRSEKLTTIPLPVPQQDGWNVPMPEWSASLIEYGGKVAVFDRTRTGVVDLWVLEDAGKREWSMKRLVLQPCQRHLVDDIYTQFPVKGTTQDGKVILQPFGRHSGFYILLYDIQLNDLRKVQIQGVPDLWSDKQWYSDLRFMDDSESNFCFKSLNYFETKKKKKSFSCF